MSAQERGRGQLVAQRGFGELLHVPVDRENQAVARRRFHGSETPHELSLSVHFDLLAARRAAQPAVVLLFEAFLPDHVVLRVALAPQFRVLVFGDLADVTDEVRPELVVRIVAHGLRFEIEAG